jgi:hypothetical protein
VKHGYCPAFIDVLLQYLALGRLRIAKVHHLVEQLVNDDEIVSYALLFQLLEIFGEYLDDFMEE